MFEQLERENLIFDNDYIMKFKCKSISFQWNLVADWIKYIPNLEDLDWKKECKIHYNVFMFIACWNKNVSDVLG